MIRSQNENESMWKHDWVEAVNWLCQSFFNAVQSRLAFHVSLNVWEALFVIELTSKDW